MSYRSNIINYVKLLLVLKKGGKNLASCPTYTQKYQQQNMQQESSSPFTYHADLPLARTPYTTATSLHKPQTAVKKAPSSLRSEIRSEVACTTVTDFVNTTPSPPATATNRTLFSLRLQYIIFIQVRSLVFASNSY